MKDNANISADPIASKIGSIAVFGGAKLTLYQNANFLGKSEVLTQNVSNVSASSIGVAARSLRLR